MLTNPYASLPELKNRMQVTNDRHDADMSTDLMAASVAITNQTGRRFELENTTEARTFQANGPGWRCFIDDLDISDVDGTEHAPTITTTSGGRTDTYTAHTGEVILCTVQRSNVVDLIEGDTYTFPVGRGCWVKVTPDSDAQGWGWGVTPAPIVEATLLLASRYHKRRNSPEGAIGFEGAGVGRIAGRDPDVAALIAPYIRVTKWVS